MSSPSVQLLRVLRSAELLQSSLRGLQRASQLRPSKLIPSTSTYRPVSSSSPSSTSISQVRYLSTGAAQNRSKMSTTDRGPPSKEDTQTDFGDLNVLGSMPAPTTSIDACLTDGFHFDNGLKISGGSGCLLVAGEAFSWRPWEAFGDGGEERKKRMLNQQGQWDVQNEAWGLLDVVWPKPGTFTTGFYTCPAHRAGIFRHCSAYSYGEGIVLTYP